MALDTLRRIFLPWSHDSMLYEVTPRCNLRCVHCYNVWKDGVDYPEDELPTGRAKTLVRKAIKDSRCTQFTFTGGEPLLRDDLEELVALAKSLCDYVVLITNGTLLPEDRIAVLGLVTTKSGQLESKDDIKRRIEAAAKFTDINQLCLSPQCGFASTEEGNVLAEDEQWVKLAMIVEVAQEVWG